MMYKLVVVILISEIKQYSISLIYNDKIIWTVLK